MPKFFKILLLISISLLAIYFIPTKLFGLGSPFQIIHFPEKIHTQNISRFCSESVTVYRCANGDYIVEDKTYVISSISNYNFSGFLVYKTMVSPTKDYETYTTLLYRLRKTIGRETTCHREEISTKNICLKHI